jgi:hypothetical protein
MCPREKLAGAPAKMMTAARAAELILKGVSRNQALIVFPASIRWGRRACQLFPHLLDGYLLRQMREWRRYRPAAPASPQPDITSPR